MVDVRSVFKSCGIKPDASINRNIQNVGTRISESSNPHAESNDIIKRLGGTYCIDPAEAPVIAKVMVEQAIIFTQQQREYDPDEAMKNAKVKVADMKAKHPYLFVMKENSMTTDTAKPVNDKKARALAIFEANRGKKASDVAKLIQVELGITFANAYYYVSRVFK